MALASLKVSAAVSVQGQTQPGTVQVKSVRVSVAQTTGLTLISGGGWFGAQIAYHSSAADYSLNAGDRVVGVSDTSVPRTVTLVASSLLANGTIVIVKDESVAASLTNPITILPTGADTIDGLSSFLLQAPGEMLFAYVCPAGYSVLVAAPPTSITPPGVS